MALSVCLREGPPQEKMEISSICVVLGSRGSWGVAIVPDPPLGHMASASRTWVL